MVLEEIAEKEKEVAFYNIDTIKGKRHKDESTEYPVHTRNTANQITDQIILSKSLIMSKSEGIRHATGPIQQ